jgi:hypothetical protein
MQITPTVQDVTFHSRKGDILHTKESKVSHLTL